MATKTIDAEVTIERENVPISALMKVEVDTQIATAKQYPRKIATFHDKAGEMVEQHMALAKRPEEGLGYALPRAGKIIEGPNARFAEIVAHCWGNLRISRDMISEETKHVLCESVCHDLESNNAERVRVRRRITNRDGIRYDDDMVTVTANAGASIARRNAVLAVIPKAQWWPLYEKSRKLAGGSTKKETSAEAKKALDHFAKMGVDEVKVLRAVGVKKASDLGTEQVATLRGIAAAIASHETTIRDAFGGPKADTRTSTVKEKSKMQQKEEASGPITGEQFDQVYNLVADLKLTMSDDCLPAMRVLGHKGTPRQFPAAKFTALIEALRKCAK